LTAQGVALRDELKAHALAHDAKLDQIIGLENKAEIIRLWRRIKMTPG
jgi:hypothetical protein